MPKWRLAVRSEFPEFIGTALPAPFGVSAPDKARPLAGSAEVTRKNGHPRIKHLILPTRVKADSFRGFQTGASQTLWRRTGGSPCGQGLHFVRTMMQPSFGP